MARVVFLGTPSAAVPTLEVVAANHEVGLVVTQPDRPRGRSDKPVPPPVRVIADEIGLPVSQPTDRSSFHDALREAGPFDIGVVVAFGRVLRPEILELPTHGFLNVHFSLLPRWRGAAPVARALMAGDEMTGVTIMQLDEGLDTGPVVTAQAVDIEPGENAGHLTERLAHLGARLLATSITPFLSGDLVPVDQSDEGLTYAEKIGPNDRPLSPSQTPDEFVDRVRGLAPDPGATLVIDGEPFRILAAQASAETVPTASWVAHGGWPIVGVGGGAVTLLTVQPQGKNAMSGDSWLRGYRRVSGTVG